MAGPAPTRLVMPITDKYKRAEEAILLPRLPNFVNMLYSLVTANLAVFAFFLVQLVRVQC